MDMEKIGNTMLMVAEVLGANEKPEAKEIIKQIDVAGNDVQLRVGFKKAINFMHKNDLVKTAMTVETNLRGWL
jgi:hypothetical protein